MNPPPLDERAVWETLRQVVDPEIGCNIVDLGLVYRVRLAAPKVRVTMTLTTPGCPMHDLIAHGVQMALLRLEGVEEAEVEVVWDPPWHPDMMSDQARARIGMTPR